MNEPTLTTIPPVTSTSTASSSNIHTITKEDDAGGGGGGGSDGDGSVRVVEHWIQPTDTFQGICLQYGVTSTQLRRANFGFSTTNLSLAPNPLKVPNPPKMPTTSSSSTTTRIGTTSIANNNNNDDDPPPPPPTASSLKNDPHVRSLTAVSYFLRRSSEKHPQQTPPLAETEARCYLELNEWDVAAALEHYRKDLQRKKDEAWDPNGEVARFDTPLEFVVMDDECT